MHDPVFAAYARYYDALYRDKDYEGEAGHVLDLLGRYRPHVATLLDLGCGTGGHARPFLRRGLAVDGVDRSPRMLEMAEARRAALPPDLAARWRLQAGDVRDVRVGRTYDAVVSLFHVASYLTESPDLAAFLATARAHLAPGGVLLFDVWYGPAVLPDRPAVRVKRFDDGRSHVTRIAEPTLDPHRNVVDVRYEVHVRDRETGRVEVLTEVHPMRYLFGPEVADHAAAAGLEVLQASEWMPDRPPGFDTWSVSFVCRARG